MTLPLRKKRRTTALSIPSRETRASRNTWSGAGAVKSARHFLNRGILNRSFLAAAIAASTSLAASAQTSGWQPTRLQPSNNVRPLSDIAPPTSGQPSNGSNNHSAVQPAAQQRTQPSTDTQSVGSGVTLRWRTSSRVNGANAHSNGTSESSSLRSSDGATTASSNVTRSAPITQSNVQPSGYAIASSSGANPLRTSNATSMNIRHQGSSSVQQAAYQQISGNSSTNEFGDGFSRARIAQNPAPSLPIAPVQDPLSVPEQVPVPGGTSLPPSAPLPGSPPSLPNFDTSQERALNNNQPLQPAPAPSGLQIPSPNLDEAPALRQPPRDETSPSDQGLQPDELGLPNRRNPLTMNCEALRERLRNDSLKNINLDTAPRLARGLANDPILEKEYREQVIEDSEIREWSVREGTVVIKGKMLEIKNDAVVLDVDGNRRSVPLRELSDADLAYAGRLWNIPSSCGATYSPYEGRDFIASAMQWKASGLCHKPLYFEEPQLERYGHEVGPILQPLISSAHFFGNIAILPYKMGIHPPTECQYALGYYRPGSCAPYMLPPIPWSLRGAAVQAGAVVGGAAMIP